jgi:hypothetical protein
VRDRLEQGVGGHQHPRRADAALGPTVPYEGLLHRAQLATSRESFDRGDLPTADLTERHETGADRLAVQAHRARTAVAGVAADLGAGQPEVVAEDIAQPAHRVALDRDLEAVDAERRHGRRDVGHASTPATARRTRVSAATCR